MADLLMGTIQEVYDVRTTKAAKNQAEAADTKRRTALGRN